MKYEKCRSCEYRCSCCSSREDNLCCPGCENNYDEFQPTKNIIHCPLDGNKLEDTCM